MHCLTGLSSNNIKPDSPLPLKIGKGEEKEVNLYIGDSVEEGYPEEAILFIRTSRPASCRLTVNGKAVEKRMPAYTHLYDRERGLEKEEKEYAFYPTRRSSQTGIQPHRVPVRR